MNDMDNTGLIVDHIHLISEDPETTAFWYAEKLGGRITAGQEVLGAPQFHLAFGDTFIIIRGRRPGEVLGHENGLHWGTDHFGFQVPGDFDGFCFELRKKGVRFTVDPVDFNPGLRLAFIEAPDGVSIELLQRKRAKTESPVSAPS
jgi:lactoylglutathione lyase